MVLGCFLLVQKRILGPFNLCDLLFMQRSVCEQVPDVFRLCWLLQSSVFVVLILSVLYCRPNINVVQFQHQVLSSETKITEALFSWTTFYFRVDTHTHKRLLFIVLAMNTQRYTNSQTFAYVCHETHTFFHTHQPGCFTGLSEFVLYSFVANKKNFNVMPNLFDIQENLKPRRGKFFFEITLDATIIFLVIYFSCVLYSNYQTY